MNAPSRRGQSIAEVLVALAVGAIFVVAAAAIIAPSLRESSQAENVQEGATVAQSLLSSVRVFSESGWSNITSLSTGTAYQYYLITSSTPYVATSGVQSLAIGSTTFTRYFFLSDAYRTSGGTLTSTSSGNTFDPSTKQVSVVYDWTNGTTSTISAYITRNDDVAIDQTDWSGGPGASGATSTVGDQFTTSTSNINYASTTGSIYLAVTGSTSTPLAPGDILVTDMINDDIQAFTPDGHYVTTIGSSGSSTGELNAPFGATIDASGNIWVSDSGDGRVVEFSSSGRYVSDFGIYGSGPGDLVNPYGLAFDKNGNMWVTDTWNDRVTEFTTGGVPGTQFGTYGSSTGEFVDPYSIAIDANGNFWVSDVEDYRVEEFSSSTAYVSKFGVYGDGSSPGELYNPHSIAIDASGNIWVADNNNDRVVEFNASGTQGNFFGTYGDGSLPGELNQPDGIAIDANGDIWVTDTNNYRVVEFNTSGTQLNAFGSEGTGTDEFEEPTGITIY